MAGKGLRTNRSKLIRNIRMFPTELITFDTDSVYWRQPEGRTLSKLKKGHHQRNLPRNGKNRGLDRNRKFKQLEPSGDVEMICAITILGMHIVDINFHFFEMHSHCLLYDGRTRRRTLELASQEGEIAFLWQMTDLRASSPT